MLLTRSTMVQCTTKADPTNLRDLPEIGRVLRRVRVHNRLSLREVERRIGRSNAYLSQIERGIIKQPNPVVIFELAELYGLRFETLAEWARWVLPSEVATTETRDRDTTKLLICQAMELDSNERTSVLSYIESLLRKRRT